MNKLNNAQKKAVIHIDGPLLVLAGAGTGKTRVITYRIAYMIASGIPPSDILGLTFTNKAANEMRERLSELLGKDKSQNIFLSTFHSFCLFFLKKELNLNGYLKNFSVASEHEQISLIKETLADLGLVSLDLSVTELMYQISMAKNRLLEPDDIKDIDGYHSYLPLVYHTYRTKLMNQNILDFDDLLLFTIKILKKEKEVLRRWQNKFQYILVDEYQDTNYAQFEILRLLAGENQNLCVVGDDDQSIYSWRGAEVEHILRFPKLFPKTKIVRLEQNYRSCNKILQAANAVITKNPERYDKALWSNSEVLGFIKVKELPSPEEEAEFIINSIQEIMFNNPSLRYNDIAVFYRSNNLSRTIEHAFISYNIPYRIIGGKEFLQRKEILDALAYLKIAVNPRHDQSLLRILNTPPRGIGTKTIMQLKKFQKLLNLPFLEILKNEDCLNRFPPSSVENIKLVIREIDTASKEFSSPGNLYEKTKNYLSEIGFLNGFMKMYKKLAEAEERRANVLELLNFISTFEATSDGQVFISDFIEKLSLFEDNDKFGKQTYNDAVNLMTVHAAKGLEFESVFICAMEKDIFPHKKSIQGSAWNEELRLFYVAITRAKKYLTITSCKERPIDGRLCLSRPSEFISYIPKELLSESENDNYLDSATAAGIIEDIIDMFD